MGNAFDSSKGTTIRKNPCQKSMRAFWKRTLLAAGMAVLGGTFACAKPVEVDGIAAIVNGEVITRSQVMAAAQTQVRLLAMEAQQSGITEAEFREKASGIEKNALNTLIDRQLILSNFKELGAQIRPQHVDEAVDRFVRERFGGNRQKFIEELGKNGLSFKQFRDSQEETIIVQAMRSRAVGGQEPFVTPAEEEQFWKENKQLFQEDGFVKIRTITIPKTEFGDPSTEAKQKALAEEIHTKLKEGADFATMARTNSVDSGAEKGGERGVFAKKDLNAELSEAAFRVPVGSVSRPIDLGNFYTLLLVEARDQGRVAPLNEVREEVRRRVLQNKRQETIDKFLARLRRDANIRTFD